MATLSAALAAHMPRLAARARRLSTAIRAAGRTTVFLFKVFPMLPSRPLNWVTARPVLERVAYRTSQGETTSDLYRPSGAGPFPGIVVCLGVVPFGVDHPQVPRLGEALARAGFATLLYWSPAMRDYRLDPVDVNDIAAAYAALLSRPDIDPARSGLLGTCVGGAFALMGATRPAIRDRVAFVMAYAAYASMADLAHDITSATRQRDAGREPWAVDPLTRTVYVHSLTALLDPAEAEALRSACADRQTAPAVGELSPAGRAILPLLTALAPDEAASALRQLPAILAVRLAAISPTTYLGDLGAPLVVLLHDREDPVIPVSQSRQLRAALTKRSQVRYTEFTVFRHLDPTRGNPRPLALARELIRFARAVYPVFQLATASPADRARIVPSGGSSTIMPQG